MARYWRSPLVGLVIGLVLIGTFFAYLFYEGSQRKHKEQVERETRHAAARDRLQAFARSTNSSAEWEGGDGRGGSLALDKMLTVDLERTWLTVNPVLFVGAVVDVSSVNANEYRLQVQYRPTWRTILLSKEFHIDVACPKEKAQPILDAIRGSNARNFGGPGVAVAAKIDQLRREVQTGESDKTVITGVGNCVDLLYIGNLIDVGRH